MSDLPKKLPLSISGLSESEAIRMIQKFSAQLGLSMTFEAGSSVSIHLYMPGACMKEQSATHSTTSVGNITDSTVGSVGTARDVSVFVNRVESSPLAEDTKAALVKARHELETLSLNPRLKEDVAGYLDKVADELQQPKPDGSRLRHLLETIKNAAAPVASALSIAASLTKLLSS